MVTSSWRNSALKYFFSSSPLLLCSQSGQHNYFLVCMDCPEWGITLRGCWSLLEIVFVGQCEVFVCLGFGHFILFVYFFLGREAHRSANGVPIL